jgi:hypothetical protein
MANYGYSTKENKTKTKVMNSTKTTVNKGKKRLLRPKTWLL